MTRMAWTAEDRRKYATTLYLASPYFTRLGAHCPVHVSRPETGRVRCPPFARSLLTRRLLQRRRTRLSDGRSRRPKGHGMKIGVSGASGRSGSVIVSGVRVSRLGDG